MSRVLPAHANLGHLKNQAKDLLRELQRRNPGSKFAHPPYAIAREYELASGADPIVELLHSFKHIPAADKRRARVARTQQGVGTWA